jgi:hypothetical protein
MAVNSAETGKVAQLESLLTSVKGVHCEQISYDAALKRIKPVWYKNLQSALFWVWFIPFLLGPGISWFWWGWNYCMEKSGGLFWVLTGVYIFLNLLTSLRVGLYIGNVKFCTPGMAISHVKYHYTLFLLEGAFFNFYMVYTWCHNLFAMGGSGICAVFFCVFYFTAVLEAHSRYCENEDGHTSVNSTYNTCGNILAWIDGFVVISVITFYIAAFWLDDDLDFSTRSATECYSI